MRRPVAVGILAFMACSRSEQTGTPVGSGPTLDAAVGDGSTGRDARADDGGGRDARGGDSAGTPSAQPSRPWDWTGIIGTGQSLSVGVQGTAALTKQPFNNLKLSLGSATLTVPPYDPNIAGLSVVPLVEPIRPLATNYPSAYPANIYGETPHTAMADQVSDLYRRAWGGDYVTVHTVVGESGQLMSVIDKTATPTSNLGHAYAATLFEVAALKRLAKAAGKTYGVGGIILTHGESDAGNTNYESDLYRLFTDYNADVASITGQTEKIPLFVSQQQTCPGDNSLAASLIAQWKAGLDHPGEVICVGPKYQYPYANDHLHLVAQGYDGLGEKYAEVYYESVVLGHDWQPLQPISATAAGNVVTIKFHVPVPPLAWDTTLPAPHQNAHTAWKDGKGFEVLTSNGEQTISSVQIQGDSVLVTLAAAPTGTGLTVQYALTQDGSGMNGGLATGRIGQLRDSDPLTGYATKAPQYNYAVSFTLAVH